jgi:hypothetical protein
MPASLIRSRSKQRRTGAGAGPSPGPDDALPPQDPTGLERKRYLAIVRSDGALLPIEERLGRRRLRSLTPESLEARRLLQSGAVAFVMPDGTELAGVPLADVYERLSARTTALLSGARVGAGARRNSRETLASIARWKRSLSIDH